MKRGDDCLLRAADADEHAIRITDPEIKRQFAKIADQWRDRPRT